MISLKGAGDDERKTKRDDDNDENSDFTEEEKQKILEMLKKDREYIKSLPEEEKQPLKNITG